MVVIVIMIVIIVIIFCIIGDMLCVVCRYIVHPDNRLTLRAQVEIKAGEEVSMCSVALSMYYYRCSIPR